MKALWYMTKRSFCNNCKKLVKKPATYLILLLILLYIFIFGSMAVGWKLSGVFVSDRALVTILTGLALFTFFSNFVTYAKKRGIIFMPSHAHFIFTAPIGPKTILLMGAMKNYAMSLIFTLIIFAGTIYIFELSVIKAFFLSFVMFILETIFEASLIVFLYANEKLSPKFTTWLCRGIYVFMAGIVLIGVLYFRKYGVSPDSIIAFVDYPVIQMIPLVGWNIALYRLVILGATTLNVVCSILYFLSVAVMFLVAYKMKCTGEYYEEAAKFADDYVEFYKRSKNGEVVFTIGQKKKFKKKASVNYKATGAKAIFYRQLLEYRKERFFIFGGMTLVAVIVAVIVTRFMGEMGETNPTLALLGVIAYLTFCATGYTGKYAKELKNPYLYLIPDTPFRKLWYATAIEHIRSLIDGSILVIIIGISWKVPVIDMVMAIVIYVILQANKLYMRVFAESVIGAGMGDTARQFIYMLSQSAILGMGILFGALAGIFGNVHLVAPVISVYCVMVTILVMFLASARFERMEQIG